METELPIKPVKKKVIQGVSKRIKPVTKYDVVADVLDKPANITVRDLLTENPKYRRRLTSACKSTRTLMQAQGIEETIALIEDEETDTTAVYSQVIIESHEIRTLIDCGAAKTCISKSLADALNLKIDTSSENVFTLGNGSRQPALGIIYALWREDWCLTTDICVFATDFENLTNHIRYVFRLQNRERERDVEKM